MIYEESINYPDEILYSWLSIKYPYEVYVVQKEVIDKLGERELRKELFKCFAGIFYNDGFHRLAEALKKGTAICYEFSGLPGECKKYELTFDPVRQRMYKYEYADLTPALRYDEQPRLLTDEEQKRLLNNVKVKVYDLLDTEA